MGDVSVSFPLKQRLSLFLNLPLRLPVSPNRAPPPLLPLPLSLLPFFTGSKEYTRLEKEAQESFRQSLHATGADASAATRLTAEEEAAKRLQRLLATLGPPESVRYEASAPHVDDDDSWMEMTPGQLDQLLQAYQTQAAAAQEGRGHGDGGGGGGGADKDEEHIQRGLQDIVAKLGGFVQGTSGLEGVENDAPAGGDGELDFDSDGFIQALQRMVGSLPDDSGAGLGMGLGAAGLEDEEDEEDEDEDEEDAESSAGDSDSVGFARGAAAGSNTDSGNARQRQAMREVMDEQLEAELRDSHVQSGFEKVRRGGGPARRVRFAPLFPSPSSSRLTSAPEPSPGQCRRGAGCRGGD